MARINQIIPFSCIDGPGNRTSIFFQGCNFKCTYCHNPETINHCIHCGQCVATCPVEALKLIDQKVVWDQETCVDCDQCIRTCKYLCSPKTKDYSVEALFEEIKQISPFIEGITVSGGECTLNAPFLIDLFKKVKSELNLTCFVDTNGGVDLQNYEELVAITDKFMLDIKSMDDAEHKRITGVSHEIVLKNLSYLLEQDKLYEVRTVIAPGLQNKKTVKEVAELIKKQCHFKLNAYRKHGVRPEGLDFHGEKGPTDEEMQYYHTLIK